LPPACLCSPLPCPTPLQVGMEAQRLKEGKRSAEDALGKAVVEGEKTRVGGAGGWLSSGQSGSSCQAVRLKLSVVHTHPCVTGCHQHTGQVPGPHVVQQTHPAPVPSCTYCICSKAWPLRLHALQPLRPGQAAWSRTCTRPRQPMQRPRACSPRWVGGWQSGQGVCCSQVKRLSAPDLH
jgi:hypothetical protein